MEYCVNYSKHIDLVLALITLTIIPITCLGILPLPYPLENSDEELIVNHHPISRDPKSIEGYFELYSAGQLWEMELPSFDNQGSAIGYVPEETFRVNSDMRDRVEFWKKIYSEYTSSQAVLQDADYPELSYIVLDISRFTNHSSIPYRKRMKAMDNFFKEEKEKIIRRLTQIHYHHGSPDKMPVELYTLFKKFEHIHDRNKFLLACGRIRAQVGQRDHIVKGFLYGGRYFNQMTEIFAKKRVPKELTRLPLVESAFNLSARSKVGASGIWQFMRSTGKRYLRINRSIDERNDPISATWAAADLLKQNYETLHSWPLAVTAYNHGREGVARAVRSVGSSNLKDIINNYKASTFGFASSNFYAEFLAILEVEREYRRHFGKLMVDPPISYHEVTVIDDTRFNELVEGCQLQSRELATYNPALTDWVTSGRGFVPQGFRLRVPIENKDKCRGSRRVISSLTKLSPNQKLSFNTRRKKNSMK